MSLLLPGVPPLTSTPLTWAELLRSENFYQNPLIADSNFERLARKRSIRFASGLKDFEYYDTEGTLRPIAFAGPGPGMQAFDSFTEGTVIREERDLADWKHLAHPDHRGRPKISPRYSPWQILYADDVVAGAYVDVPLSWLSLDSAEREARLDRTTEMYRFLIQSRRTLDADWAPTIKVLVRLQQLYFPEVSGVIRGNSDAYEEWRRARDSIDPDAISAQIHAGPDQLTELFWFLVDRGFDRDPNDGLELIRRSQARVRRDILRDDALRALDNYQAAQVLSLFLKDLTGKPPEANPMYLLDGRQGRRKGLYDRGPAGRTTRLQLQDDLISIGLYPHAVHVVGEGESERVVVQTLVKGLISEDLADEVGFTDLGGVGIADRLSTMVSGFTTYARETVLIVDQEGKMAEYAEALAKSGKIKQENLLIFKENLEESNFTVEELLSILSEEAANPSFKQPAVILRLTPMDVQVAIEKAASSQRRGNERKGLAGILLKLAEQDRYGPTRISKPQFAEVLGWRIVDEALAAWNNEAALEALKKKRPIFDLFAERIYPVLAPRTRI